MRAVGLSNERWSAGTTLVRNEPPGRATEEVRMGEGDTLRVELEGYEVTLRNDMEVPIKVVLSKNWGTPGCYVGIRRASIFASEAE
jgi:hypothetical protein